MLKWLRSGSAIWLSRVYDETNNNDIDISFQLSKHRWTRLDQITIEERREVKFQECVSFLNFCLGAHHLIGRSKQNTFIIETTFDSSSLCLSISYVTRYLRGLS